MKQYLNINIIVVFLALFSCKKSKQNTQIDKKVPVSIAFGWMNNDVSSLVWLNDEPIVWLKRSGYLRSWDGEPLKAENNILRVDVLDDPSIKVNWPDFTLRTVVDGKQEGAALKPEGSDGRYHFDFANAELYNKDFFLPGIVDGHTKQNLLKWSLIYLQKIESKDTYSIKKMVGGENISDFCPWASVEAKIESRVRELNQMGYVQGKSFALIYPSNTSKLDALLVSNAESVRSKINYFLFFKDRDGNYYFKTRESQQYLRIFIEYTN